MTDYEKICSRSKELDAQKQQAVLEYINKLMNDDKNTSVKKEISNKSPLRPCPNCGSTNVIKAGLKRGKQRFKCKDCHKHYITTTGTIMENSHYGEDVWQTAVADTLSENVSIDKTAEK